MKATLNIGLNIDGKQTWDLLDIALGLYVSGINFTRLEKRQSDTEETAVVELKTPLNPIEGYNLSYLLYQDCIAQQLEDASGMLYGPKAEEWGPFNPEYFLTLDTENQNEND